MVKKSLGYVEMEWTCPNCGVKNPGMPEVCTGCGAAQPSDVKFHQAAQEELITDEEKLRRATSGPDVHCIYCGARNPAGSETCVRCGGDLTQAAARESGRVVGAHRAEPAKPVSCPSCGSPNDPLAQRCTQCGSSLAPTAPPVPAREVEAPKKKGGIGRFILPAILLVICGIIAVVVALSLMTDEAAAQVQSVEWTRTIAVEALQPVTHEDWYDDIPSDAELGTCTQKVHHTQDEPAANSREVCGTPYTVETGSGAGEVVQDCEYEVYADWCEYIVDEWQVVSTAEVGGMDLDPSWPSVTLGMGEREGERSEEYIVVFESDGERYTYTINDEAEFRQFKVGSEWILEVNKLNAVRSVSPAD